MKKQNEEVLRNQEGVEEERVLGGDGFVEIVYPDDFKDKK